MREITNKRLEIELLNDMNKQNNLKYIDRKMVRYLTTPSFDDFNDLYNMIRDLDGYEIEQNMTMENIDDKYIMNYDFNLYDPEQNFKYIKTYELQRELDLV